jgi:hypothetical protein
MPAMAVTPDPPSSCRSEVHFAPFGPPPTAHRPPPTAHRPPPTAQSNVRTIPLRSFSIEGITAYLQLLACGAVRGSGSAFLLALSAAAAVGSAVSAALNWRVARAMKEFNRHAANAQ